MEPLSKEELEIVRMIAKAINQASAHTPWESACLAQSLTAQKMLKRRGIHGIFYLGVTKEESDMKAHAWSQCGDIIVTGEAGHEAFTVLSVLSWGRE
jgi:hypothetical protein